MSGAEGFGPSGPAAGEAAPFAVAGPSQLSLDAARVARASFTVSNVTGRPVRARLLVQAGAGADPSWFRIAPEADQSQPETPSAVVERTIPVAGTATVDVTVRVADQASAGPASFWLAAALEESPQEMVSGPTVGFDVPPPKPERRFPWWIVIAAAVALVVLVAGGILIWILTRPDPEPQREVLAEGTLTLNVGNSLVDVESTPPAASFGGYCRFLPGSDLCFYDQDIIDSGVPGSGSLSVSSVVFAGVAIVADADSETCVAAMSDTGVSTGVEISDASASTFVCFITGERHYAVLEIPPETEGDPERTIIYTVWEGNA